MGGVCGMSLSSTCEQQQLEGTQQAAIQHLRTCSSTAGPPGAAAADKRGGRAGLHRRPTRRRHCLWARCHPFRCGAASAGGRKCRVGANWGARGRAGSSPGWSFDDPLPPRCRTSVACLIHSRGSPLAPASGAPCWGPQQARRASSATLASRKRGSFPQQIRAAQQHQPTSATQPSPSAGAAARALAQPTFLRSLPCWGPPSSDQGTTSPRQRPGRRQGRPKQSSQTARSGRSLIGGRRPLKWGQQVRPRACSRAEGAAGCRQRRQRRLMGLSGLGGVLWGAARRLLGRPLVGTRMRRLGCAWSGVASSSSLRRPPRRCCSSHRLRLLAWPASLPDAPPAADCCAGHPQHYLAAARQHPQQP